MSEQRVRVYVRVCMHVRVCVCVIYLNLLWIQTLITKQKIAESVLKIKTIIPQSIQLYCEAAFSSVVKAS